MATTATKSAAEVRLVTLPVAKIKVRDGFNPRQEMDQEDLAALAESIKVHGLLQPLVAAENGDDGVNLLGGHRRFAAAQIAGLKEVPVVVRPAPGTTGTDELEAAILDNAHRTDLNPLEEAMAYERLIKKGMTAKGVSERLTVAQRRVTERLRILDVPKSLQPAFADGSLSPQHAKPLAEMTEFDRHLAELVGKEILDPSDHRRLDLSDPGRAAYIGVTNLPPNKRAGLTPLRLGDSYYRKVDVEDLGTVPVELRKKLQQLTHNSESWNRYAIRIDQAAIDALRAGGVLYAPGGKEADYGVVKDRELLRTVCEPQIEKDFKAMIKQQAEKARASAKGPDAAAKADERAKAYQASIKAREFNLLLGDALAREFNSIDLSLDVARWLCLTVLMGNDHGTPNARVSTLAARGLRYVLPQWQNEVTQKNGKVKVTYPSPRTHATSGPAHERDLEGLFWEWWKLAATPQEIVGRTLIAFAAAQYARPDAVPMSQRYGSEPYSGYYASRPGATMEALQALESIVGAKLPKPGKAKG
jgi:ParB/RepB/Spo0J family partition protein